MTKEATQYRKRIATEDLCRLFAEAWISPFVDIPAVIQKPLALTAQGLIVGLNRQYLRPLMEMIQLARAIGLEIYKADRSRLGIEASADLYVFVRPGELQNAIDLVIADRSFLSKSKELTFNDFIKI